MRRWKFPMALSLAIVVTSVGADAALAAPGAKPGIKTDWLTKPAESAVLSNQFAKAAVLYQGAIALKGTAPLLLWRLAQIYTMGGKFNLAIESYRRFLEISKDPQKKARANSEIQRLLNSPAPFVTEDVAGRVRQNKFALKAVKRAKALKRKRKYREAIRHYEAAMVMDNRLVGVFRLLGALYGKLQDKKLEQAFYIRYLRLRPGGPLAVRVRKRLKDTKEVAKVDFKASFPSRVYINYLPLSARGKTPFKDVVLPSGNYTIILYHQKFHAARKLRITVKKGQKQAVKFDFGVIVTKLKPWARVRANGRDLGLWGEIGMPAGRYKLVFTSGDGKKKMIKNVELKPGQRLKITKWN